jgi:hypothetical protein
MGLQHSVEHAKRSSEGLENRILKIVNGEFDLDALKLQHEIYSVTEEIEDETRGLKSVATEFVVNEFFTTASSLYNFLSVINDTFESALEVYCRMRNLDKSSVFFVWKGETSCCSSRGSFWKSFRRQQIAPFESFTHPSSRDRTVTFRSTSTLTWMITMRFIMRSLCLPIKCRTTFAANFETKRGLTSTSPATTMAIGRKCFKSGFQSSTRTAIST